jgi:deoxyribose-phosphate aldolase
MEFGFRGIRFAGPDVINDLKNVRMVILLVQIVEEQCHGAVVVKCILATVVLTMEPASVHNNHQYDRREII